MSEGQRRLEFASSKISVHTPELDQARIWLWLGILSGEGAAMQAATVLDRAVGLYRRLDDVLGLGYSLARLGRALSRMGRFAQAEAAFAEALPILQAVQAPSALGGLYNGWGISAMLSGDHTNAEIRWTQALKLFVDSGAERSALYVRGHRKNGSEPLSQRSACARST